MKRFACSSAVWNKDRRLPKREIKSTMSGITAYGEVQKHIEYSRCVILKTIILSGKIETKSYLVYHYAKRYSTFRSSPRYKVFTSHDQHNCLLCFMRRIIRLYVLTTRWLAYYANCIASLAENRSYHWTKSYSSTKLSWNTIWNFGVQLWGSASNSNLEILERFPSKVLRIMTDAPWYVPNAVIKTWLTSVIGLTRRAKLQCHLQTKAWRSPQTVWQNLCCKEQIIFAGLNGIITLQI